MLTVSNASIALAQKRISGLNIEDELIQSMLLELTMAEALSSAYIKVSDSIFWNKAKESTKNRIRCKQAKLLFNIADNLFESIKLLKMYRNKNTCTPEVETILTQQKYYLNEVKRELTSKYSWEIKYKQLSLF